MEDVGVFRHRLASLMTHNCPSHVLVIIVSNMVVFLLEGINKICPSGFWPKNCRLILGMLLTESLPPISDMGKGLKEHEGDFFTVGKLLDNEITL
jgi:hypothetical protein